ncbi:unnamed protein product [Cuscuta europaea]|uniref:Uncharacterized protein n=1 Tax=Cuscuta europaea TaxID=41803 RepID=A0A9P0Z2P2_CUSEU|nr:unnamed protein product [Cuscuta europaea]
MNYLVQIFFDSVHACLLKFEPLINFVYDSVTTFIQYEKIVKMGVKQEVIAKLGLIVLNSLNRSKYLHLDGNSLRCRNIAQSLPSSAIHRKHLFFPWI